MEDLLTIKEIARRLKVAESTVKYWRDKYPEYMPVGEGGRYPKYRPEAIRVFQIIGEGISDNLQQQEIANRLSAEFALNIERTETRLAATTAATTQQQQPEVEFLRELVKQQAAIIEELTRRQLPAGKRSWWPFKKGKH